MNFSSPVMKDFNAHFLSILAPHIVVLGVYILTGIFGNSIVIYIYLRKMRESTDSRFFIPCLAVADIFASTICGISAILMSVCHVTFTNDIACKLIWFSMTSMSSGAAMILVFIAYHRYMKICKLFKHGKLMDKKITVVVCLYLISFVISFPIVITSGVTKSTYENSTFHSCERIKHGFRKDDGFLIAMTYTIFEAIVVISIATILTVVYTKVGLKLFKHFQFTNKRVNRDKVLDLEPEYSRDSVASINSQLSMELQENKPSNSSKDSVSVRIKRKKDKFNRRHKYTYIFIAISVVCIVTYTPRLILMIIETVNENFWFSFNEDSHLLPFLKILNRFYIINNIVNPFLYAMFDPKFKRKLVNIFTCKSEK